MEGRGIKSIKVETNLMEVRVVVTDSKGRIVEDLKKEGTVFSTGVRSNTIL